MLFRLRRLALSTACLLLLGACDDGGQHQTHSDAAGADANARQANGHLHHGAEDAGSGAPSDAEEVTAADGQLSIANAYVRQPAPGQTVLAAFATVRNASEESYALHQISSPQAESVEVHRTVYEEGVMRMRAEHHLVVQPGSELEFKPGGLHMMLIGVEGELKPGDKIPLIFSFDGDRTLEIDAEVRPLQ